MIFSFLVGLSPKEESHRKRHIRDTDKRCGVNRDGINRRRRPSLGTCLKTKIMADGTEKDCGALGYANSGRCLDCYRAECTQ